MNLINLIIELRYKNTPESFDFKRKLFQVINDDKMPTNIPPFKEGLSIDIKKKKMKVIIESNRTAVGIELIENINNTTDFVKKFFCKINKEINWNKIDRIGVKTIWAHTTTKPLNKLIAKFKNKFYSNNDLISESEDIALCLTLEDKDNNSKINYNSGIIEKNELINRYFNFKDITVPKRCVLVDIDYYKMEEFSYSDETLSSFLDKALNFGEGKANKTIKILGV